MRTYLTALTITALLAASSATAAPAPVRTVHMYGDSITSGWGFGTYDHKSPINRIDRIAQLLATANGSTVRFRKAGHQDAAAICRDVLTGKVKRQDVIVFEDAGPHTDQAEGYTNWLGYVAFCANKAKPRNPKQLVLTTMFDYDPNPVSTPFSTYDEKLPDGSGLSINDVTRHAARTHNTSLLDWNGRMDSLAARFPMLQLVHPDGIHPTVLGNIVLAGSLVRREGVRIRNVDAVVAEVMAQRSLIVSRGMAPEYDEGHAREWVRVLVG